MAAGCERCCTSSPDLMFAEETLGILAQLRQALSISREWQVAVTLPFHVYGTTSSFAFDVLYRCFTIRVSSFRT